MPEIPHCNLQGTGDLGMEDGDSWSAGPRSAA